VRSNQLEGATVENRSGDESATPGWLWRPLARAVDGFDLDPASGCEPDAIADVRLSESDDGLSTDWASILPDDGGWVFVNPPWSDPELTGSPKDQWLSKVRREAKEPNCDGVVVVLPSSPSASWWQDHVATADVLCQPGPGRVTFVGVREGRNPSFATVVAVWGDPLPDALVDALQSHGLVWRPVDESDPKQRTLPSGGDES